MAPDRPRSPAGASTDAAAAADAAEGEPCCWICLASEPPPVRVCACPSAAAHPACLARWQLQQAGKPEEKSCRFCAAPYADWRKALGGADLLLLSSPQAPSCGHHACSNPPLAGNSRSGGGAALGLTPADGADGADADGSPHSGSGGGGGGAADSYGVCTFALRPWAEAAAKAAAAAARAAAAPPDPIMAVTMRGQVHKIAVRPGPEGRARFQEQVCQLLGYPSPADFDVVFECKVPGSGERVQLSGMAAFDAATHCAAVSAARRLARRRRLQAEQQRRRADAAAAAVPAPGRGAISPRAARRAAMLAEISSALEALSYNGTPTAGADVRPAPDALPPVVVLPGVSPLVWRQDPEPPPAPPPPQQPARALLRRASRGATAGSTVSDAPPTPGVYDISLPPAALRMGSDASVDAAVRGFDGSNPDAARDDAAFDRPWEFDQERRRGSRRGGRGGAGWAAFDCGPAAAAERGANGRWATAAGRVARAMRRAFGLSVA